MVMSLINTIDPMVMSFVSSNLILHLRPAASVEYSKAPMRSGNDLRQAASVEYSKAPTESR